MCCGTCIQSTIRSASPGLVVSDILSLCSLLCTLYFQFNSPLKTSGRYCLICSLDGHMSKLRNIKYRKLAHVIIISDTTCSEILNLKARSRSNNPSLKQVKNSHSSSIGCNFLRHPTLLPGNSFCLPLR